MLKNPVCSIINGDLNPVFSISAQNKRAQSPLLFNPELEEDRHECELKSKVEQTDLAFCANNHYTPHLT